MSTIVAHDAIESLPLGDRPLVVCDVDEVVLEFITPFQAFLKAGGYELQARSFGLHGNIFSTENGKAAAHETVSTLQEAFFAAQAEWQGPAEQAREALVRLDAVADIVFLTAMPPRHAKVRRALLDRFAMPYPMIASESAKGPIAARLHRARSLPIAFIDDIASNLRSVAEHCPDCLLINLMANAAFRALAPAVDDAVVTAATWREAERAIRNHFGV